MKDNKELQYSLVLENRLGDYQVIEINRLEDVVNNNEVVYNYLESIDSFTSKYTMKELEEMIKDSKMVIDKYAKGQLRIVDLKKPTKHNHSVLTLDVINNIDDFAISTSPMSQREKDILRGKFNQVIEKFYPVELQEQIISEFNNALNNNDKHKIVTMVYDLPAYYYEQMRKLYFVINNIMVLKQKNLDIVSRKLEKNDNI